jgi:GDP-4-dehydro-6-deoxy-D-mannose reductase
MNVLVTGAHGFLGRHVLAGASAARFDARVTAHARDRCELTGDGLPALLAEARPDLILHLAGRLTGGEVVIRRDNDLAAERLFAAALACRPMPRVVLAGSAAVYGVGGSREKPIAETTAPTPKGLYAETKHAAERHAARFRDAGGDVVIARISNPVGPGMGDHLLCGTIARQVVAIERNDQPPVLELRDLSPWRDFVHVADVAAALWLLARIGVSGEAYNVAAGRCVQVRAVVDLFLERARVRPIEVKSSAPGDERSPLHEQWLDGGKLGRLGWRPARTLADAVDDLLQSRRVEPVEPRLS